jgi:hypothetical protein
MLSLFIVAIESQPSKMKYHTVGKVPPLYIEVSVPGQPAK